MEDSHRIAHICLHCALKMGVQNVRKAILAAAALALMTGGASAAYLSGGHGSVLVNGQPVPANAELVPGDRVKAVSAQVKIVYANGAVDIVNPGQTAVVRQNAADVRVVTPEGSSGPASPQTSSGFGIDTTVALIGAGVVATGVGVGLLIANSSPASP
jgi:hypothetical protein